MTGRERMDVDALREEIEKLVLLEEIAERRQKLIEQQLDEAIQEGISQEQIRKELKLSKESVQKLLDQKIPDLADRLGISRETAKDLSQPIG
jgi:predicted XRE-type DNA-binding protein